MSEPWTPRTLRDALLRWAERTLARWNARHPWSHNQHFHPWVRRSLPPLGARVLDVGCGRGDLLAELADGGRRVEGIDPDPGMAYLAAERLRDRPTVTVHRRTLAEQAARPELAGAYDAVTMIASLHHMELRPALRQARELLRPGGRLLVVTLTRPESTTDRLWELVGVLSNPVIGLVKHPRPATDGPGPAPFPTAPPRLTHALLREACEELLPGARIRRREAFRVTLRWERPVAPALSADAPR